MNEYSFEFQVGVHDFAGDPENAADALYDQGLDDALVAWRNDHLLIQVDREASDLPTAIMSALQQIEAVEGLRVEQVEPIDLVTVGEIARRMNKTKAWASQIVNGKRGDGTFPKSIRMTHLSEPRWRWEDVQAWFEDGAQPDAAALTTMVAITSALNALLELRALRIDGATRATVAPLIQQAGLVAS